MCEFTVYISRGARTAESSSTFKLFIKPRARPARSSFLINFSGQQCCNEPAHTFGPSTSSKPITVFALVLQAIHHNLATYADGCGKNSG